MDELGSPDEQKLGISLLKLTIASESQMVEQAKILIERVQQEITDSVRDDIISVITTIAVYRFANLSRDEVEAMLGVNLQETRVYQEAKAEGREEGREELRLELVPRMLARDMTMADVAQLLGLTLEQVRLAAEQKSSEGI